MRRPARATNGSGRGQRNRGPAMRKTRNRTFAQSDHSIWLTDAEPPFWPVTLRVRHGRGQRWLSIDNPFAMNANTLPPEVAIARPAGTVGLASRGASFRAVMRRHRRCCSTEWCAGLWCSRSGAASRPTRQAARRRGIRQTRAAATVEQKTKLGERRGARPPSAVVARPCGPFWTEAPNPCVKSARDAARAHRALTGALC